MTEEICDFCSAKPVVWCYHVLPLPIEMGIEVTKDEVLIHVSASDWAACATCKVLVDAKDQATLAWRSVDTFAERGETPDERRESFDRFLDFQDSFFRLQNGPGEPYPPTDERQAA